MRFAVCNSNGERRSLILLFSVRGIFDVLFVFGLDWYRHWNNIPRRFGLFLIHNFDFCEQNIEKNCLAAWIKFKAPTLTNDVALDVGRNVFWGMNRIEIFLCFFILLLQLTWRIQFFNFFSLYLPAFILVYVQVLWLQPKLDSRRTALSEGQLPTKTFAHVYYVIADTLKILSLLSIPIQFSTLFYR